MGLFSWASDAWDGVTHAASDAWSGVTSAATSAAGWIGDGLGAIGGFLADHWKTLAAVAVGTLVFVGVATFAPELLPGLFALAPELAPWLVLGGAGAASGAATRLFDDVVAGRTPGWDVLSSAAITGALTVVTAGTLQWVAPRLGEALPLLKPLTDHFAVAGSEAGDGAGSVDPLIPRPAPDAGATSEPPPLVASTDPSPEAEPPHISPREAFWRAPKARGILGLIAGDTGNAGDKKNAHEH